MHTQLKTSLVYARSLELQHLALKFGQVGSLLEYMSATLKSMHEAWEDVLLMMDTKLATYSSVRQLASSVVLDLERVQEPFGSHFLKKSP